MTRTTFFYVVSVAHAKSREHLMHTVQSADDVMVTEPFAVEVELLDTWHDPEAIANDALRVFRESESAEWLAPDAIAPFKHLSEDLWRYKPLPDLEHPACVILTDRESATPVLPITGPHTPTCMVVAALESQGWTPHPHLVTHTALMPPGGSANYDSRVAMRQKWYYQALATLPSTLPLCGGSLPSVHPVAFYKLLLRGEAVRPGMGAKYYTAVFNRSKKLAEEEFEPVEAAPPNIPLETAKSFLALSLETSAKRRSHDREGRGSLAPAVVAEALGAEAAGEAPSSFRRCLALRCPCRRQPRTRRPKARRNSLAAVPGASLQSASGETEGSGPRASMGSGSCTTPTLPPLVSMSRTSYCNAPSMGAKSGGGARRATKNAMASSSPLLGSTLGMISSSRAGRACHLICRRPPRRRQWTPSLQNAGRSSRMFVAGLAVDAWNILYVIYHIRILFQMLRVRHGSGASNYFTTRDCSLSYLVPGALRGGCPNSARPMTRLVFFAYDSVQNIAIHNA